MHYKKYKTILSPKNGMNLYRGCTHGCIYCDSRSLCYNFNHDFEDIEVKENAPAMLEAALKKKRSRCMITTGAMCDPYIPLELELKQTRRCLEVIEKYGFGVTLLTKSPLILRDSDLLTAISKNAKCVVQMTLTTYDDKLCGLIEPNVAPTSERFRALMEFKRLGIPTIVWLCPLLPFINDTEENVSGIMDLCEEANVHGVVFFGSGLTLRTGDREYFYKKLDEHFPGLKQRYIDTFALSYECESPNATRLNTLFYARCKKAGIMSSTRDIFSYLSKFECANQGDQLSLF